MAEILVAGGTGFVGSHIVGELWKGGTRIRVLSRDADRARKKLRDIEVEYVKGDVRNPSSLTAAVKGVRTVICCVQFPNHPVENPAKGYTYEIFDAQGTRNLVEACKAAGIVEQFIYLSGAGTRPGRPHLDREPWFRAKLAAEEAVKSSGMSYTIFRPSWLYGREDHSLNRFVSFARMLPFVPVIGDGKNRVQPLFILDLAKTVVAAIGNDRAFNRTFEVGGPQILTMDEVIQAVLRALAMRKPIVHQPSWIIKLAAAPLSLLPKPPLSPGAIDFLTMDELVDNRDAREALGFEPRTMDEILPTYLGPTRAAA